MKLVVSWLLAACVASAAPGAALAAGAKCAKDAAPVGDVCVDLYEASVWQVPEPTGKGKRLVKQIQSGKASAASLLAGGALQLGCPFDPILLTDYPASFPADGNWTPVAGSSPPTPGIYAASLAGVLPSGCLSYFQALQACRLAGKHLVTNAEWQSAVAGTPDPGAADDGATTCATEGVNLAQTGARSACVSHYGVRDMIGNVWEYVSDWADRAGAGCTDFLTTESLSDGDVSCFGGDGMQSFDRVPGPITRGGSDTSGVEAGAFAVSANNFLSDDDTRIGFRCAR
jgi:sulfatase-modifying factor enzyme 1